MTILRSVRRGNWLSLIIFSLYYQDIGAAILEYVTINKAQSYYTTINKAKFLSGFQI